MDLTVNQIDQKPKKVGDLRGRPVFHLRTKGGLHVLVTPKGTSFETLGTGPHAAVSRHIAMKHEPDIVWTDLSKSDHVNPQSFELILPKYETITNGLRDLQNENKSD